ncbi:MAG: hypothetical protein AB7G11_13980 [Phycisphaerales bacterium]
MMVDDPTTSLDPATEQTRRQLEVLFGAALERTPPAWFYLWSILDERAGRWFDSIDDAVSGFVDGQRERTDVYVCGGLRFDPPRNRRFGRKVEDLDGIVGFLGDFDVKDDAFKSIDDARAFAETAISHLAPPSMLVRSGGGVQAWWLLTEPWIFENAADLHKAMAFSRRFGETLRQAGRAKGVKVDSTHDLARVFRVAGTFNRKLAVPRPTLLEVPAEGTSVRRYNLDDLDPWLTSEEFVVEDLKAPPSVGHLIVSADRNPPEDARLALVTNNEKAAGSWEGKRPDLVDDTPSSLDFSLAVIALNHDWTDQEVADLIIAGRRHRGDDLKTERGGALRLDYYQRTIASAKKVVADEKAARDKADREKARQERAAADEPAPGTSAPLTPDAAREIVRRKLGIEVEVVEQHGRGADRALLAIVLADGRKAKIGRVNQLLSRDRVRDVVVSDFGVLVPPLKPRIWNEVARALVALIVRKAEGDTDENEAVEWLRVLLNDSSWSTGYETSAVWATNERARREGLDLGTPEGRRRATDPTFIDLKNGGGWFFDAERRLWVYPQAVRQALVEINRGLAPTLDVVRDRLKALGFEPEQIKSGAGGKTGTRQWWKAPAGFAIFEGDHKGDEA